MESVAEERSEILKALASFERRIDEMHVEFQKIHFGEENRTPDWMRLEQDLLNFSRRPYYEVVIAKNLDRLLYKFQNRKKLWLSWL